MENDLVKAIEQLSLKVTKNNSQNNRQEQDEDDNSIGFSNSLETLFSLISDLEEQTKKIQGCDMTSIGPNHYSSVRSDEIPKRNRNIVAALRDLANRNLNSITENVQKITRLISIGSRLGSHYQHLLDSSSSSDECCHSEIDNGPLTCDNAHLAITEFMELYHSEDHFEDLVSLRHYQNVCMKLIALLDNGDNNHDKCCVVSHDNETMQLKWTDNDLYEAQEKPMSPS